MILLIDNYDSFVFNLERYFCELGCETEVVRNDAITVDEIVAKTPDAIVISPGPCTPEEAGISVEAVRQLAGKIPILGICLGHQAIAAAFDAKIERASMPVHGRSSEVFHSQETLFHGLPTSLTVGRYHSLVIDEETLPDEFQITSRTSDGIGMSIENRKKKLFGLQFHPESILTQSGHLLLANFLDLAGLSHGEIPQGEEFDLEIVATLSTHITPPIYPQT